MKKLRVIVDGKAYDVTVQILDEGKPSAPTPAVATPAPVATPTPQPAAPAISAPAPTISAGGVQSPLAGKVVSIDVKVGQEVTEGQQLLTLEAMKMNTYIHAPKAGKVAAILAHPGDVVEEGKILIQLS